MGNNTIHLTDRCVPRYGQSVCQMPAWHVVTEPQMLVAVVPVAWIFFIKFASVEDQCPLNINILTTNDSLIFGNSQ